jgi:hypothetical protein
MCDLGVDLGVVCVCACVCVCVCVCVGDARQQHTFVGMLFASFRSLLVVICSNGIHAQNDARVSSAGLAYLGAHACTELHCARCRLGSLRDSLEPTLLASSSQASFNPLATSTPADCPADLVSMCPAKAECDTRDICVIVSTQLTVSCA